MVGVDRPMPMKQKSRNPWKFKGQKFQKILEWEIRAHECFVLDEKKVTGP